VFVDACSFRRFGAVKNKPKVDVSSVRRLEIQRALFPAPQDEALDGSVAAAG
jgi:hypothetical protein